jgi:hypothetical protein
VTVAVGLEEIDPELDHDVVAAMILSAISPPVLYRMRTLFGGDPDTIERSALHVLRGITSRTRASAA